MAERIEAHGARVVLSFDVEVWCNGWSRLDEEFPGAFHRYVYGGSREHGGALPLTLSTLRRHGLKGVFFVEPLFAARFGRRHLREIVELIAGYDQSIQLHLHSEWADEISPRPLPHISDKQQHLQYLRRDEQATLIRMGVEMLQDAGVPGIHAFRAGSFAANRDTFCALADVGIGIDSSINAAEPLSVPDLRDAVELHSPSVIEGVRSVPLTVFRDGLGRAQPAQIGSCSFEELRDLVRRATGGTEREVPVINFLSHNFEMLRPGSTKIDPFVARRFERLCAFLASCPNVRTVDYDEIPVPAVPAPLPLSVGPAPTLRRVAEQLARRVLPA